MSKCVILPTTLFGLKVMKMLQKRSDPHIFRHTIFRNGDSSKISKPSCRRLLCANFLLATLPFTLHFVHASTTPRFLTKKGHQKSGIPCSALYFIQHLQVVFTHTRIAHWLIPQHHCFTLPSRFKFKKGSRRKWVCVTINALHVNPLATTKKGKTIVFQSLWCSEKDMWWRWTPEGRGWTPEGRGWTPEGCLLWPNKKKLFGRLQLLSKGRHRMHEKVHTR